MENIKKMSKTMAKLLILIKNMAIMDKFGAKLAEKICKDYNYTVKVLKRMKALGWLQTTNEHGKRFYHLTQNAPIEEAAAVLADIGTRHTEQQKFVETKGFKIEL